MILAFLLTYENAQPDRHDDWMRWPNGIAL